MAEAAARSRNKGIPYRDLAPIITSDGREAQIRGFGSFGKRVAYIETPDFICIFYLSAPDKASGEKGLPAFDAIVSSFRYHGADSPKSKARREVRRILLGTTEIREILRGPPSPAWEKHEPSKPGVSIYQRTEGDSFGVLASYTSKPSAGDSLEDYQKPGASWRRTGWERVRRRSLARVNTVAGKPAWVLRNSTERVNRSQSCLSSLPVSASMPASSALSMTSRLPQDLRISYTTALSPATSLGRGRLVTTTHSTISMAS